MENIHVKMSDKQGTNEESTGDFALAVNIEDKMAKVLVQGDFNTSTYINLIQFTVRTLVKMGYENNVPASIIDSVFQDSFRLAVNELKNEAFDIGPYLESIDSLKVDIRLKSFRKLCLSYAISMGHVEIQKQFDTNILLKAKEIVSIISPVLAQSELFINPLIEYGVKTIELNEMIERLKENLTLLHELCIALELSTLEEVITVYKEYHQKR